MRHPSNSISAAVLEALLTAGCCLTLFSACQTPFASDRRIVDSTLIKVLADLHLSHARSELFGPPPAGWRDSVLADYGVDSAEFRATLIYYSERPGAYTELYSEVLDRVNEIWNTRRPAPMSLPDSLAAAEGVPP